MISDFFKRNLDFVIIFYGLTFIVMFFVLFLQRRKAAHFELLDTFKYLSLFGLTHGIADIMVITPNYFHLIGSASSLFLLARFIMFVVSFLFLLYFGLLVLAREERTLWRWMLVLAPYLLVICYLIFSRIYTDPRTAVLITKRFLNLPANLLASFAFLKMYSESRRLNLAGLGQSFLGTAIGFLSYGFFAGFLTTVYPQTGDIFGIPTQVFRAVSAATITIFVARILSVFEVKTVPQYHPKEIAR